jgi:hypothetical protein
MDKECQAMLMMMSDVWVQMQGRKLYGALLVSAVFFFLERDFLCSNINMQE